MQIFFKKSVEIIIIFLEIYSDIWYVIMSSRSLRMLSVGDLKSAAVEKKMPRHCQGIFI